MHRTALGVAVLAAACQSPAPSAARLPITNPSGDLPATMSKLRIDGVRNGITDMNGCHATLIDPAWALTAAHCFDDFDPSHPITLTLFGDPVAQEDDVRFHPLARLGGEEDFVSIDFTVEPSRDLALIHLDPPLSGHPIAKLWRPQSGEANAEAIDLVGKTLIVAGHGGDWFTSPGVTGTQTILELEPYGSGPMLDGDGHSALQPGDSGGGAFLVIDGGLPGSIPFWSPCALETAAAGETALVAVNSQETRFFTPVYLPENGDWIAKVTRHDRDEDTVCDEKDNCIDVKNPEQENCNRLAEVAPLFGAGKNVAGDACDPIPCPAPSLEVTDEIVVTSDPFPHPEGDMLVSYSYGRTIADELHLTPVLEVGTVEDSQVKPRFCYCRADDGTPIDDVDICAQSPFFCELDPAQAAAGVQETGKPNLPDENHTYWHEISIDYGSGPPVTGEWFPIDYPGSDVVRTWAYEADFVTWHSAGWMDPLPFDATYGDGTDLAGVLWARDKVDPLSNGFAYAMAPDARTVFAHGHRIPRLKPAPWWTYCAPCGDIWRLPGEERVNPAPFLTIDERSAGAWLWTTQGAIHLDDRFSGELRDRLAGGGLLWLSPGWITAGAPRAVALSSDGTRLVGAVSKGEREFAWTSLSASADGTARTGFAAAWAREAGAVLVAGGIDELGGVVADLAVHVLASGDVLHMRLEEAAAPRDVLAAAWAPTGQLWALEAHGELRVLDVASGRLVATGLLGEAAEASQAWLSTLPDGRILLAAAQDRTYTLAILDASREGLRVTASYRGEGHLAAAPAVSGGTVSVALEVAGEKEDRLEPTSIDLAAFR